MAKNNRNNCDIDRSDDRIAKTGEVFTPPDIVDELLSHIPDDAWEDPTKTFLENSAGTGNIAVAIKERLLKHHDDKHILDKMLYCIELMPDNFERLCERLGVDDRPEQKLVRITNGLFGDETKEWVDSIIKEPIVRRGNCIRGNGLDLWMFDDEELNARNMKWV
jgi:hypothetical protein